VCRYVHGGCGRQCHVQEQTGIANGDTSISVTAFVLTQGFQLAECILSLGDKRSVQNDSQQASELILACTVHCVIRRLSCTFQFRILCVTQVSPALLPIISTVQHRGFLLWRQLLFFVNVQCTGFLFLISNFRRVLNVVCFLLGNSPASECYMPTFRNTLSVPYFSLIRDLLFAETSAYKIQTPGNYAEESIQQDFYCRKHTHTHPDWGFSVLFLRL
jgi:hypothetical protein